MDTFECISKRSSVRAYQAKPIARSILEKLVDAGRRAPTARALEPWEFVVVTNREILKKLGETANSGDFIKDSSSCIAVFCKDTKYYLEDGSAATENILLAAADIGLGACWVAGDKKPYVGEVSGILGAPSDLKLVSLISLGWPRGETRQAKSRKLKDVIHWEGF
ncbi:MAG: nitroreductase [Omnitrophica bacterium RBG_13_46_9]|nr:MAG: nitroreductase [Omnitrophica bacterium RBG_13_46_9]